MYILERKKQDKQGQRGGERERDEVQRKGKGKGRRRKERGQRLETQSFLSHPKV